MELIVIYGVVLVGLFAAAFVTKRRFGLLGLALAAGSLLSGIWGYDANLVAGFFGFRSGPMTSAIVTSLMVLLPPGLLLFHGYTYKSMFGRVIGAVLFSVLATTFLVEPLSHILTIQGPATIVYQWIVANRMTVIGVGLVAAIVDLFLTKPAHSSDKHHKH